MNHILDQNPQVEWSLVRQAYRTAKAVLDALPLINLSHHTF